MQRSRKYTFTPNPNNLIVLAVVIAVVFAFAGLRSCTRYDRRLRGAAYSHEAVLFPEYQVRPCAKPDGTPTADYFEIYPPNAEDKVVYLTFDDGPSPNVTPQILDILKRYHIKATFFVIGKNAEARPELIARAAREGHSVAIHTYSHDYDYMYGSPEGFLDEISKTGAVLTNILGEKGFVNIFRFPGGAFREERAEFKQLLIEQNIPYVNWNSLTGDAETQTPVSADLIARAKRTAVKANSPAITILMHDAGAKQATADALPGLIDHFLREGYRFDSLRRY